MQVDDVRAAQDADGGSDPARMQVPARAQAKVMDADAPPLHGLGKGSPLPPEDDAHVQSPALLLQREVVARMTALPDTADYGRLSVMLQIRFAITRLFTVPAGAFRPAPKVWSTVVHLRVRKNIAADVKDEKLFWQVVSAGFAHPRKTILNNLREAPEPIQKLLKQRGGASIVLCEAGIPPLRRAETLALEEWALLLNAMG